MERTSEQTGLLEPERGAILAAAYRMISVAKADPGAMTREELADAVGGLVATSEHAALLAGRYMDVGDTQAVCLTKGEKTMTALVNSRSRIDKRRCGQLLKAGQLKHRYTHFHNAVITGRITSGHTEVFLGVAKRANSHQVAAAEKDLAALAVLCTPEEFRAKLAEWEAAADPDEHLDEFIRAQARRNLSWGRDLFGNIHIGGTLEPIAGEQVVNAILNRRDELEPESDVKGVAANHDALVDLILGESFTAHIEIITTEDHNPDAGTNAGNTVGAAVAHEPCTEEELQPIPDWTGRDSVLDADNRDLDILARLKWLNMRFDAYTYFHQFISGQTDSDQPAPPVPALRDIGFGNIAYPHTVAGTRIPPAIVDQLAKTGRVRRHLINPDGTLRVDTPAGRRFTAFQKRMIRLRDNHCQHPGCAAPARFCDNDHIHGWETGGKTLTANGQLLCRFHHRWKHRNHPTHGSRVFDNSPVSIQRE